jgi:hypothetical protein
MHVRPNENTGFARCFKPRARGLAFETVDYFTAFTLAPPDSEHIRVSRNRAERNAPMIRERSRTPAFKRRAAFKMT